MTDATRAVIRVLYFVDQVPVDVIAAELRLSRRAVRRALVVPGGVRRRRHAQPVHKETDS